MRHVIRSLVAVVALFSQAAAIPGTPDAVPAATVVTPYFEVDPNGAQDTLLVVTNVSGGPHVVHMEVWSVGGEPVFFRNFTLSARQSSPLSMRQLIGENEAERGARLVRDGRWRGFVTFDVVTAATERAPTHPSYPFGAPNVLEGWIYYTRLTEGSSNGLRMLPIEYVGTAVDERLRGFYGLASGRESVSSRARSCARQLAFGAAPPCSGDPDGAVDSIDSRVFLDPRVGGATRIVVFAWGPGSTVRSSPAGSLDHRDESGKSVATTPVTFSDAVTVVSVTGNANGWAEIVSDIPADREVFAFSFNSAVPGDAATNWDAIFVSRISP